MSVRRTGPSSFTVNVDSEGMESQLTHSLARAESALQAINDSLDTNPEVTMANVIAAFALRDRFREIYVLAVDSLAESGGS